MVKSPALKTRELWNMCFVELNLDLWNMSVYKIVLGESRLFLKLKYSRVSIYAIRIYGTNLSNGIAMNFVEKYFKNELESDLCRNCN